MRFDVLRPLLRGSPALRRAATRGFFELLSWLDQDGEVTCMNYGYLDADEPPSDVDLPAEHLCRRLYERVAGALHLRDRDVLEVGCGRGGGAVHVMRTFEPRSLTGLDCAEGAVAFCRAAHLAPGLAFVRGDAEALPFEDACFDAGLNVESSHGYGSRARFLAEVYRVLRPGGALSWADFVAADELPALEQAVSDAGIVTTESTDITTPVLAAMAAQEARYRALVERRVPRPARALFLQMAGVRGSDVERRLRSGEWTYLHRVFRKPP